jgi:hypothetical protein
MPQLRLAPAQIRAAAQALLEEGQIPTLIGVRRRLGGGSPQSIAPVLAHWLAEQPGRAGQPENAELERAELLDEIGRQDERIEALLAALGASEQALAQERRGSHTRAAPVADHG